MFWYIESITNHDKTVILNGSDKNLMLFWNLKFLASPWKYHLTENLQIRSIDPDKRPGMGDRIKCRPTTKYGMT